MYKLLNKVKEVNPLVLHYTNEVTINDCANITLALGASPLMSYSYEEVDEIVSIASSVVINIGTMDSNKLDLFIKAGKAANKYNKPVILDPVGVFATKARSEFTAKLIKEISFDVIKGNIAELKYISGLNVNGKGVDSLDDDDISEVIKKIASKLNTTIVATGKIDFISDGNKVIKVKNGTNKLKCVTGTGCMTGSLIGSYLAVSTNILEGATMGVLTMALSGQLADKNNIAIGDFKVSLMNNVYEMDEIKLKKYGEVE